MSAARSILNPGNRHLAAFIFLSAFLHIIWFVWYALQGSILFAPQPSDLGVLGMGGGEDIVFQLSRGGGGGSSGGEYDELPQAEMDLRDALPEMLTEDAIEAPLIEEEAAIPVAPAESPAQITKEPLAATTAKTNQGTSQAGQKTAGTGKGEGGDGGDADETRRNRAGNGLSGEQISKAAAGRTLNLIAGRLDIPSGNRLMNVKIHLFPDGTSRVQLTYFHYKTFHKLVTSTRHFKGDGKWWIEKNALCLRAMVVDYGTINCYEINQRDNGEIDLYFSECTRRSSSICARNRIGAKGHFSAGIE